MKKQDSKNNNDLTQGQVTAVLEDVNSKFDLIMEQFSAFRGGIDEMRQEIRSNHSEFLVFRKEMLEFRDDMLEFKGDMLEFKGDMLEFRDGTEKNFKIVFEYLTKIDDEISDLKNEFKELKILFAGKAELQRVIDAEERLAKLEQLVFAKLQ